MTAFQKLKYHFDSDILIHQKCHLAPLVTSFVSDYFLWVPFGQFRNQILRICYCRDISEKMVHRHKEVFYHSPSQRQPVWNNTITFQADNFERNTFNRMSDSFGKIPKIHKFNVYKPFVCQQQVQPSKNSPFAL